MAVAAVTTLMASTQAMLSANDFSSSPSGGLHNSSSTAGLLEETTTAMMTAPTSTEGGGYEFSEVSKITLTVVISFVTLMGLLGNTVVILIVLCYKDMHTIINFSFANLALTDLTLLLLDAVPTATDTIGGNLSAKLGCNFPIYLQYVSIC